MKRLTLVAAGFACTVTLLFEPSIASAAKRHCDGMPYGTLVGTVVGDVVVPAGGACLFDGATVTGDVIVGADAWADAQSTTITGDYTCDRCLAAHLHDSRVGGNYRINEATLENEIIGSVINGTLRLKASGAFIIEGNRVGKNLTFVRNTGVSSIVDNTISGSLRCRNNVPLPANTGNAAQSFKGQCSTSLEATPISEEVDALSSTEDILDYLKDKANELKEEAGGAALDWVSSEVQFQTLITEGYSSVKLITTIYDQLENLSQVVDPGEREREAKRLQAELLPPSGKDDLLVALKTISDVLLGVDEFGQNDALIKVFADRWFAKYTPKQLDADVPLRTYPDQLDAWLRGVFLIQYMGMVERATARIADGDFGLLQLELEATIERMDKQKKLLDEHIPGWTRTLPDAVIGGWHVIKARDLVNGKIDNSQVMYGSPATGFIALDYTVQFRSRHPDNGDEEWACERQPVPPGVQNDVFFMRERSRPNYVSLHLDPIVTVYPGFQSALRIVMGRTKDPAVPATAPRRDLYVPVIGFVGLNTYMTWTRGNLKASKGPIENAVRVEIVPAGH